MIISLFLSQIAMVESKQNGDITLAAKLAEMKQGNNVTRSEIGFLKGDKNMSTPAEKIVLTSYPRSGNTLIRTYLEKLTRIYTGSDCDVRRPLNKQLQDMGMAGEGQIDDRVWIVKSHYPERIGRAKFAANKCIIIVRNPLDSIFSLFNMVATTTHSESIS